MVFSEGATVFGRLQLLRKLGEGRCSTVWLANDPRYRRQIALKVFRTDAHEATEEERRLWRELLRRQRIVNHPNTVMPLEFYSEMGYVAIAGAFVDGPTFAQLLRQRPEGRFNFEEARKWLVQVGLAMVAAHTGAKIVHGNLNAFNVLVNPVGDAKVCDFGFHPPIAGAPAAANEAEIQMKLACVSPERLNGSQPSFADDVYAFGVFTFQLLTGRNPARQPRESAGENAAALDAAGANAWRNAILAALSPLPAERPVSIVALMQDVAPQELYQQIGEEKMVRPRGGANRRQRLIMAKGSRRRKARNALITKILLAACLVALPLIIYRIVNQQHDADGELAPQNVLAEQIEYARLDAKKNEKDQREARLDPGNEIQAGNGAMAKTTSLPLKPLVISNGARNFFEHGKAAFARGDLQSAIASYDLAIALQPDWHELLEARGYALLDAKRPEAAITDFSKALMLDANRVTALLGRAQASLALGNTSGARQDFETVLKLKPDSEQAKEALGGLKK
ncbi:MAG TPA: protein kinase [Chthoniobacterales bacterium]